MNKTFALLFFLFLIIRVSAQAPVPASYSGAWNGATPPTGWTFTSLGADITQGDIAVGANFNSTASVIQINYNNVAGSVTFKILPNALNNGAAKEIWVQESVNGTTWTTVSKYIWNGTTSFPTMNTGTALNHNLPLNGASRFVKFIMPVRATGSGNFAIDDISINSPIVAGNDCSTAANIVLKNPTTCSQLGTAAYDATLTRARIDFSGTSANTSPTLSATSCPFLSTSSTANWTDVWVKFSIPAGSPIGGIHMETLNFTTDGTCESSCYLLIYETTGACPGTSDSPVYCDAANWTSACSSSDGVDLPNFRVTAGKTYYLRLTNKKAAASAGSPQLNLNYELEITPLPAEPSNHSCSTTSPFPTIGCNYGAFEDNGTASNPWQEAGNDAPSDLGIPCTTNNGPGNSTSNWYTVDNPIYFRIRITSSPFTLQINNINCNGSPGGAMQMAIFRDCGSVGTYTPTTGGTAKFFGCAVASSNSATISGTIDPSLLNTDLILVCDGNAGDNCSFGFSASNVVLPIELEMFSVFCEEDNIDLRWSTYSEINNAKFIVEKSFNNEEFTFLGEINGAGNSQDKLNYSLNDPNPNRGTTYYRLTQVDYDGVKTDLGTISSEWPCKDPSNNIQIFPNPTEGDVNLVITRDDREDYCVQIYNSVGQSVIPSIEEDGKDQGTTMLKLRTNELPAGVYLIKVIVGERVYTEKLVINK